MDLRHERAIVSRRQASPGKASHNMAGPAYETYQQALRLAEGIHRLAYNIWWTWNPNAQDLFKVLSEESWTRSRHNAIAVIKSMSPEELAATLYSNHVRRRAEAVIEEFEAYLNDSNTWANVHCPHCKEHPVAYFSAEFGLHESLPIYSGGLGILAGDMIKSASDLGLPFIGISLFYRNGYFTQRFNQDGWQEESYPTAEPSMLPIELVTDKRGQPIVCEIPIAHGRVTFHAWRVQVGRCALYLLDTNRSENEFHWREITSRVYGGDQAMRVCQEMVLGVGGVRLLRKLGIAPSTYHLNEGHSAFLLLDLLREQIEAGKSLKEACDLTRKQVVFTTHTPVPAGHDRFSQDLLDHLMHSWPASLKMTMDEFMDLGRVRKGDKNETFCMTVLALGLTRAANAVSELHGQVSREMWRELYGNCPAKDVPIGHVTNGVHILGWMNRITFNFWDKTLGTEWLKHLMQTDFWEKIADRDYLADEAIWGLRFRLKRQMIEFLRRCQYKNSLSVDSGPMGSERPVFNPDILTIGFARRFATYKRADLIFRDENRIAALLGDSKRPVQLVFAGKAHPQDDAGKRLIQRIYRLSRDPRFLGKLLLVENYDVQSARYLVSGCDVWLNNPRRPLEASGTSGQKTLIHGCLNLSILDGWWREGYNGSNGFAIGEDSQPATVEEQERVDSENLYRVLEREVIPEYYDRDGINIPRRWIQRIRNAMITLVPVFNTDRMVAEYATKYYMPADK
jgi:starch phosphorylase